MFFNDTGARGIAEGEGHVNTNERNFFFTFCLIYAFWFLFFLLDSSSIMKYKSTRGDVTGLTFEEALCTGYAEDGGILLPETIPKVDTNQLKSWANLSFIELAKKIIPMYVSEEEIPSSDLNGKTFFTRVDCRRKPCAYQNLI